MNEPQKFLKDRLEVPTIDVLEHVNITSMFNQTDKKITVKHYLNTYILPSNIDDDNIKRYALYVRIIFNRLAVKIKSNTNLSFSVEEFATLSEESVELLRREALHFVIFVSETYEYVAKRVSVKELMNFDTTKIFENYDYSKFEIPCVLNAKLVENILEEFDESDKLKFDFLNKKKSSLNATELIKFLIQKDPKWISFESSIESNIWVFNFKYLEFLSKNIHFQKLGASKADLYFGNFIKEFINSSNDNTDKALMDNVLSIINKRNKNFR